MFVVKPTGPGALVTGVDFIASAMNNCKGVFVKKQCEYNCLNGF